MATVIDSLFVELGLLNDKFKKGIKDSKQIQDDFESGGKKAAAAAEAIDHKAEIAKKRRHAEEVHQHRETLENYKKMREDLIKFFLIFTAGKELGEFISDTVHSSMELGALSKQTNVAVENISGLEVAFKEVGGSADEAQNSIRKASEATADFFSGRENAINKELIAATSGTGVNMTGAWKRNDPLTLMMKEADVIKGVLDKFGAAEAVARAAKIGITGHAYDLYKGGGAALMGNIKHGAAITGMNASKAKIAEEFNKQWVDVMEKLRAVGTTVLMPMLHEITKWLGNKENIKMMSDIVKEIGAALKEVDWVAFIKALGDFAKALIFAADKSVKGLNWAGEKLGRGAGAVAVDAEKANDFIDRTHRQNGLSMDYLKYLYDSVAADANSVLNLTVNVDGKQATKQKIDTSTKTGSKSIVTQANTAH